MCLCCLFVLLFSRSLFFSPSLSLSPSSIHFLHPLIVVFPPHSEFAMIFRSVASRASLYFIFVFFLRFRYSQFDFIRPIRIIITKNCEDVCCRRRYFVKKSTTYAGNANSFGTHNYRRPCELKNFNAATTNENDIRIKSMALIYSSAAYLKQPICIGTLIHPKVVMTTLVCASMWVPHRIRISDLSPFEHINWSRAQFLQGNERSAVH